MGTLLRDFARAEARFLTFRPSPVAPCQVGGFLVLALILTWVAGIGRYWDHPSAHLWQYAGLGSVAYVFVLAGLLWLIGRPLQPRGWSYSSVLLFVSMTSPPAILYAIPVERVTDFDTATALNVWFLVVVAAWRVALLLRHLCVTAGLGAGLGITVSLLPLAGIVVALSMLNLEQATFELMAMPDHRGTTRDGAYGLVVFLTVVSTLAFPILLIAYLASMGVRRRRLKEERASDGD